jgi:hypothetical protein
MMSDTAFIRKSIMDNMMEIHLQKWDGTKQQIQG